jgi:hypothetical protein
LWPPDPNRSTVSRSKIRPAPAGCEGSLNAVQRARLTPFTLHRPEIDRVALTNSVSYSLTFRIRFMHSLAPSQREVHTCRLPHSPSYLLSAPPQPTHGPTKNAQRSTPCTEYCPVIASTIERPLLPATSEGQSGANDSCWTVSAFSCGTARYGTLHFSATAKSPIT